MHTFINEGFRRPAKTLPTKENRIRLVKIPSEPAAAPHVDLNRIANSIAYILGCGVGRPAAELALVTPHEIV